MQIPVQSNLFSAAFTIPRIRVLVLNLNSIGSLPPRLLDHPAMESVERVICTAGLPSQFLQPLVWLPSLVSLEPPVYGPDSETLECLPLLRHLHTLKLTDRQHSKYVCIIIAECPNLTSLSIRYPYFYGDRFRSFFTNPNMARLHQLTIEMFSAQNNLRGCPDVPLADLDAITCLSRLTSLTLAEVDHVDAMLPSIVRMSWLSKLILTHGIHGTLKSRPSVDALQTWLL